MNSDITMTTPGLMQMVHVAYCGVRSPLNSAQLRRAYEWVVDTSVRLGIPPSEFGAKGAEVEWNQGRRDFLRSRQKFEALDLAKFESFTLGRQIPGKDEQGYQWPMTMMSIKRCWGETTVWNPFLGLLPPAVGIRDNEAEQHVLAFASLVAGSYGYIVRRRGMVASSFFWAGGTLSADFDPETQEDHSMNIGRYRHEVQAEEIVLRDLFPINLMGRRFLDLPFGDTGRTLQEWIEQDPDVRGDLAPLAGAEHTAVWRPVIKNLPTLRTELFRAGLLFYWKHFDQTQPEYRDLSEPFKPPSEVPAIFRPEFYAGREPEVTR